jgi:hypothetical protein
MPDQIKTISEKATFEKILIKFFQNNNVFLKTKTGDLKIQFVGYSNDIAAFRIPFLKSISGNCLIFTRIESNTIHALVKYQEKQGEDIFTFIINKFQIITRARGEERKTIGTPQRGQSKDIIFVTNLISHSIIQNSLAMETKKIERIKEFVQKQMSEAFNYVKIFFCNESKVDSRMNYFTTNKRPIFIPQIANTEKEESSQEKYNYYINNIYSKDHFLQNRTEYISEISVPLLYKLKMPYGYIQLNNTNILSSSTLTIAKKFAVTIDELLNKENVFPRSAEKLIVSNVSRNGIGIVFKERKYIRYFKEHNSVYFDLLLPESKTASILAIVRNITIMENNIILIGCSIEEIDALSEVNYSEFLDTIPSPDLQPQAQPGAEIAAKPATEEQKNTQGEEQKPAQ